MFSLKQEEWKWRRIGDFVVDRAQFHGMNPNQQRARSVLET